MSAQSLTAAGPFEHTRVDLGTNPYADVDTVVLADSLEAQYDRGEPLHPAMVFEILNRLLDAEGLALPASER